MKTRRVKVDGQNVQVTEGSGNVFADLGRPDAEELQAKAMLTSEIARLLKKKGLIQSEAAALLHITQPKVSNLLRGKLSEFSTDTLRRYLNALGADIELVVKVRPRAKGPGHFHVRAA
jgi:predicted XRE-type DNA-binding protein